MATINEMLSNERVLLGEPLPQKPSLRLMWKVTLNHIQDLYNQASNSQEAWTESGVDLQVSPDVDEYLIPGAPLLGKPLLVFTKDDGNPAIFERPINIVRPENLITAYDGPRDGQYLWPGFWDGSTHTAQAFAFFQMDGNWYARIRPVPQIGAVYRILFVTGNWAAQASLGSEPLLTEHHHALEVRAALSLLPHCKWSENIAADNGMRDGLMKSLIADDARFTRSLERYIRTATQSRITFRRSGYYY